MKRRQFLRALGGTSAAVAGFSLDNSLKFGFRKAHAHTPTFGNKTVVFIFLRGGNDGINTVVPHGYPAGTGYYHPDFRPNIAIPKPDLADPAAALDLGGGGTATGLGLHPAMQGIWDLYQTGNVAIMPATHYPSASRSHFSGERFIESAKSDLETDGWMNRYLVDAGLISADSIRGVGFSSTLPQMLRGSELVSAFSDLRNFELGISNPNNEAEVLSRLIEAYNQSPNPDRKYSTLLQEFGGVTLKDLDIVKDLNDGTHPDLDPDTYSSSAAPASVYGTSTFARQIKQTAILIKAGRGLEVASLSRGGFDLHSNLGNGAPGNNHYNSLKDVSDGIKSFFDDLEVSGHLDDVLMVVGSEFGRTSFENGSLGVDHAHATSWFTIGSTNTVNGGVYLGHESTSYPGAVGGGGVSSGGTPDFARPITDWIAYDPLNVDNMINGRYLEHTVDYRYLYGEILENFLSQNYTGGATPNFPTLLPDFTYVPGNKLGFLV